VFHMGRLLPYQQTLYHPGKASKGLNTLAYYEYSKLTAVKCFITWSEVQVDVAVKRTGKTN
jgi:hypothetical protein